MTGGMRASRRVVTCLAALAVALGAFAACSDDEPEAKPTTTTTTTEATTASTTTTTEATTTTPPLTALVWEECDGGFECATLDVPIDYEVPEGDQLTVALVRRVARLPEQRLGTILMNPGGPGASAINFVESIPLPTELTDRFDIVGFDPRGVGRSTPLDCHSRLQELYDADPTIDDDADRETLLTLSQAFVAECVDAHGDLLPHLGTVDVARDMERIRIAMGEPQVNYVGFSYGTAIGQQYARLFPASVRTMVLDGVVQPGITGLEGAVGQAQSFTAALDAFIAACDDRGCGLDEPAGQVIDEVIAASELAPIEATRSRSATPGVVSLALAQGLYADELWPQLGRALSQASRGNGNGLVELADAYLQRRPDGTYTNMFEGYFAVSCLDSVWPKDPQMVMDHAALIGAAYPRLGEALVNDYVRCPMWPTEAEPLPPVPSDIADLSPVLIISTTGDPATPYAAGVAVREQIPGSVLVTNVANGHTAFAQGVPCIDDTVTRYIVDGVAPAEDLICQ